MFFYPCRAHTLDARRYGSQISGMKASQAEILIVPGYTNSGPDHWQSRWEGKLSTARRVEQAEWAKPVREDWVKRLVEEVNRAEKPVVLVGHSLGVPTIVHAVPHFQRKVAGAFLVAPPDVANSAIRPRHLMTFGPYPRTPLPFPTLIVASRNDPFGTYDHAEDIAKAWGGLVVDAGEAGHLNAESGHGPWPEGTMVFAQFLSKLSAED
ncbi:alpha/beta fold hydrolase [Agrobacterium vitis]|nr:alpha/beta hydrolase [Agrobacterium vitis]MCF1434079.1 serine hydrolase family protein [Allorhizobium ampelinum]MCF1474664.1 serine hydrolase family protein [Allorhizobium ampelinum]MUO90019.1 alpha/beta fold hydrolase [Agrobacterium vitis]MUZ51911.1 alpha/beta fold hydrolase [Agrobacterium vitis]MUZ63256.1 alpha/beta fold hydrolase [Agrobacterium vitis]